MVKMTTTIGKWRTQFVESSFNTNCDV